jgi:hypothetical protein
MFEKHSDPSVFEEPSEPDVLYESEPEEQVKEKPAKKRYASTKGDADKRKQQSCINLAKARQAKIEKGKLRKEAELEASQAKEAKKKTKKNQIVVLDSSSSESEDSSSSEDEIILTKRTKSKAVPIPKAKSQKTDERMDRIESIMEKIVTAKRKSKPKKVVKNTIVQLPAGYGAPPPTQPQQPDLKSLQEQLKRKMFNY